MKDLGIVCERQVVGESRRTENALIAQVELRRFGAFAFALHPASCDGLVQCVLEFVVKCAEFGIALVESVGKRDALLKLGPCIFHSLWNTRHTQKRIHAHTASRNDRSH